MQSDPSPRKSYAPAIEQIETAGGPLVESQPLARTAPKRKLRQYVLAARSFLSAAGSNNFVGQGACKIRVGLFLLTLLPWSGEK